MNSFLSTSRNRKQTLSCISSCSDTGTLQPVLFQIDADPRLSRTKPFADISSQSEFQQENEILFMLGSIFRIQSVKYDQINYVWIIQLELSSENNHDLKELFDRMKEDLDDETDILTLGDLLAQMAEYSKAKKYFDKLLTDVSQNDLNLAKCYGWLGTIAYMQDNNVCAVENHQKALNILPLQHPHRAVEHNNIGNICLDDDNLDSALEHYSLSLDIRLRFYGSDHINTATVYNNIGAVYTRKKEYDSALTNLNKAFVRYIYDMGKKKKAVRNFSKSVVLVKSEFFVYSSFGHSTKVTAHL
ncbi:unnamed protein product [Didymodactylos carnosus]|nr:unnamed protein product [Didymodactylos carnosus]CAF4369910.1 unnamed protein product [Didymodactylos carnosus]